MVTILRFAASGLEEPQMAPTDGTKEGLGWRLNSPVAVRSVGGCCEVSLHLYIASVLPSSSYLLYGLNVLTLARIDEKVVGT